MTLGDFLACILLAPFIFLIVACYLDMVTYEIKQSKATSIYHRRT